MLHVFIFSSRKLREFGWCANYMMDKRENNDFITDFVFINYSPNRRMIDDQQPIYDLELCNCYFRIVNTKK